MDYNRNGQNNQNNRDNDQWDRWNSNASNSSYYNQPTHRPYGQAFSLASAVCGLLAVTTCCTVILSLPLGALGILFAVLAHRKGRRMSTACVTGLTLSIIGFASAILLMVYSLVMLPVLMKNESFRTQLDTMTQQMYGIPFSEMMEGYGYSFE
ncbi:MAG TPA: hypothetical protein DCZ91_00505 [Lachnospiraceae bacterium]|nr:hypothetical protein [Lachnospiraceae bacterium]